MRKDLFVSISLIVFLFSGSFVLAACPSADLTGDCRVDLEDFSIMASEWLTQGVPDPDGMVWVYIDDPGARDHEGFTGEMSKYETTNAQYCQFLNAALASGDITVGAFNFILGANGSNGGIDFVEERYFDLAYDITANKYSPIIYSNFTFSVRSRDGYDMSNHPVTNVSWYGATAFCNYYGYRLPTEWEWQAVADFDETFTYGCGTTIDQAKVNYNNANPLGLSNYPYTSPLGLYPAYGYGLNDMAGNVWEWTDSWYSNSHIYRVYRGGGYSSNLASNCTVSYRGGYYPVLTSRDLGFRVCR